MCIYEVVEKGQSDLNDDLNDYEYNLTLIKYILYISDKKNVGRAKNTTN